MAPSERPLGMCSPPIGHDVYPGADKNMDPSPGCRACPHYPSHSSYSPPHYSLTAIPIGDGSFVTILPSFPSARRHTPERCAAKLRAPPNSRIVSEAPQGAWTRPDDGGGSAQINGRR